MKRHEFASELKEIDRLIMDFSSEFDIREVENGWDETNREVMVRVLQDLKGTLTGKSKPNNPNFNFANIVFCLRRYGRSYWSVVSKS